MSAETAPKKKRLLFVLATLALIAGTGVWAIVRFLPARERAAKSTVPREVWTFTTGNTFSAAALPSGESLVVAGETGNYHVVLLDRTGKQLWREPLVPDPLGCEASPSGLLVYTTQSVRYYEARGLVWQYKADGTILSAFATADGAAIVSCRSPGEELDPRAAPLSERMLYIDQKGKRAWEKNLPDRTVIWAGSSLDGEVLVTVSLLAATGVEVCASIYRRNGAVVSEVRGAGNLFSRARLSANGDLAVLSFAGKITGITPHNRWFYQLPGEARSLGMGGQKQSIVLVVPKSKYPILDLMRWPSLVAISPQGTRMWEKRVPAGSYAVWTHQASGVVVLGTPDSIQGYSYTGNRVWQIRTQSTIRSVAFFPDGTFLSVNGSGSLVYYGR